jgi:AcrR family transcriptional regulator
MVNELPSSALPSSALPSPALPSPAWKRTRRSGPTRVPLTREVIVDTALRLLDRDGLDGVSMRRVAEDLGTGAASLYAHVANKEELLDLLLDRVLADVDIPDPDPEHWQEQIHAIGMQMYGIYKSHRDIAVVSLGSIPTGPNALRTADRMMAIMLAGKVPPQVAGWALDRLALYICADAFEGSILFKRHQDSGLSFEDFAEQYFTGVRDFYMKLPADRFPTLAKHVGDLMGGDGDARFAFGLDMIIRSLSTYTLSS